MGCKISKLVTTLTTPFQGQFVICSRIGHPMIILPTKFEVTPGPSAMSPFDREHTTSYSTLTETMRLCSTVFEIQRVIYRNLQTLPTAPAFGAPVVGDPVRI